MRGCVTGAFSRRSSFSSTKKKPRGEYPLFPELLAHNTVRRAAYFFGKATREEIQALYTRLKSGKK
jgi:hypothetical protein